MEREDGARLRVGFLVGDTYRFHTDTERVGGPRFIFDAYSGETIYDGPVTAIDELLKDDKENYRFTEETWHDEYDGWGYVGLRANNIRSEVIGAERANRIIQCLIKGAVILQPTETMAKVTKR
jgi:hypothetical protein